jgi:hypothetical protein
VRHFLSGVGLPFAFSVQSMPSSGLTTDSFHDLSLRINRKSRLNLLGFDNLKFPAELPVERFFETSVGLIREDRSGLRTWRCLTHGLDGIFRAVASPERNRQDFTPSDIFQHFAGSSRTDQGQVPHGQLPLNPVRAGRQQR